MRTPIDAEPGGQTNPHPAPRSRAALLARHRIDLQNLGLIAAGWLALLLLVPPQHEHPIIDDWIYAGSVRQMLETGTFTFPDSQANLFGLVVWGALWATLGGGFSFTILTFSTLALALVALWAFYGIARTIRVPPAGALLGAALLGANPIFVHLSYSFMTDVPFLALSLLACLCYLRGIRRPASRRRLAWIGLGSLFIAWAFLIRQFAVLVPAAFLAYLAWESLRVRRLLWKEMALMVALPILVGVGWQMWLRTQPVAPSAIAAASRASQYILQEPWLRVFLLRATAILPLTALLAWAAVLLRRNRWWLVPAWALGLLAIMYLVDRPDETWIAMFEPPFTARFGPLAWDLPQEPFSFGTVGNIIRLGGIDFFEYNQEPIWSREAWRALWMLGVLLAAALLANMSAALLDWLRTRPWREPLPPPAAPYALGAIIFVVSLAFPGDLYDRYTVGWVPFVLLFIVRGVAGWDRRAWAYSLAALALVASFTVLAKADHMEHARVRLEAAQWLTARTGSVHMGYDWDRWARGGQMEHQVTDLHIDGYRTEQRFPYQCRLCGFTTRYVLAEVRADQPSLPTAPTFPVTVYP
jgi:hypothetical protein